MTGGRVVILGPTGRNLAAGMSGGLAYVLDLDPGLVNHGGVDLFPLDADEALDLRDLVGVHLAETGSDVAGRLLDDWATTVGRLTKVLPREYARVLSARAEAHRTGRPVDDVVMEKARA
jgi:glutamate synthase (NADPH/NADH) large chain